MVNTRPGTTAMTACECKWAIDANSHWDAIRRKLGFQKRVESGNALYTLTNTNTQHTHKKQKLCTILGDILQHYI